MKLLGWDFHVSIERVERERLAARTESIASDLAKDTDFDDPIVQALYDLANEIRPRWWGS